MESRTSPGKKGSVQPISESLTVAFPFSPVWVSRPVELVWVDSFPIVSGGFARPERVAGGVERLLLRLSRQYSCPGYLASPCVPRVGGRLWIS
jgi:hypothetical protein